MIVLIFASILKGLDNFMLENTKKFNVNTANLINSFLNQLNKPVCLVAHNGNKFDYPLLKTQLKKLVNMADFERKSLKLNQMECFVAYIFLIILKLLYLILTELFIG